MVFWGTWLIGVIHLGIGLKNKSIYDEVVFIKTFAIINVIIIYLLSYKFILLHNMYDSFYIWQAIPLFMLVFDFTLKLSIKKGYSLEPIYLYNNAKGWGFQHFPYAFYTLLFSILLIVLYITQSSWHIFLSQIFNSIVILLSALLFGIIWYKIKWYLIYFNKRFL